MTPVLRVKTYTSLTLQYLQYGWHDLVQVSHDSVVSDLEDGSVFVGVDSGNHLRLLYPRNVLKLPRYPEGKVEGWSHSDAGEADVKLLLRPESPPGGDDHRRAAKVRGRRPLLKGLHEPDTSLKAPDLFDLQSCPPL